jgi:predicted nucleotidyltransferase component of viral defense system
MIDKNEHRKIMFEVLREIYSSSYSHALGFKGGTMLYFFYGLDRLSVNLDFDLAVSAEADQVRDLIREILKEYGSIEEDEDKRNTIFFLLRYRKGAHGVKIEISKRPQEEVEYEFKNFYGVRVKCLKVEDAFASKLAAATERKRTAGRDFYDVYFFLKNNYDFNEKIVEERTGGSTEEYLRYLRKFIDEKITNKMVLGGVGELIEEDKKDWIRNKFKDELLAQLDFFLKEKYKKAPLKDNSFKGIFRYFILKNYGSLENCVEQ